MPMRRSIRWSLAVLGALAVASAEAAITLTGDTHRPAHSTLAIGEQAQLTFNASGMSTGQALSLQLNIADAHGATIETRNVPVVANASGNWQTTITAPAGQLGFYRVNAQLSNGVKLSSLGSRPAGYLTYAVVPDPATRVNYGEFDSFFGMQGGFHSSWRQTAMSMLGARWELDNVFDWRRNEPSFAGQWNGQVSPVGPQQWQTYRLPTLFIAPAWAVIPETFRYETGALTPAGEVAWHNYVTKVAQAFGTRYPNREEHIYQITWEPVRTWGYRGTDEQLLKIYEIAYNAIHAVDPKAVVAGPTMSIKAEGAWPGNWHREEQSVTLFQKGLGQYIDAYTNHPYYEIDANGVRIPEMVDRLRYIHGKIEEYSGKQVPLFGTEQGWADNGTPQDELNVARSLMQQNLVMMGEGYRFNFGFFAVDYSFNSGQTIDRYGYYYNLVNGIPWGPGKGAPKPHVPAYAAQSYILDGHKSAG